jgi:hypothetical protein
MANFISSLYPSLFISSSSFGSYLSGKIQNGDSRYQSTPFCGIHISRMHLYPSSRSNSYLHGHGPHGGSYISFSAALSNAL